MANGRVGKGIGGMYRTFKTCPNGNTDVAVKEDLVIDITGESLDA